MSFLIIILLRFFLIIIQNNTLSFKGIYPERFNIAPINKSLFFRLLLKLGNDDERAYFRSKKDSVPLMTPFLLVNVIMKIIFSLLINSFPLTFSPSISLNANYEIQSTQRFVCFEK